MKNIVLIGMPGSGKSTVGVVLAKVLGKPFLDTDLLIQQKQGKLLQEIIDQQGIRYFLKVEEEVILGLDVRDSVISTGGSVVYSPKIMNWLKHNGKILYLQLPFKEMEERIKNIKTRGIAMEKEQSLKALYDERMPLYEQYADIIIDCSVLGVEQVIDLITAELDALIENKFILGSSG